MPQQVIVGVLSRGVVTCAIRLRDSRWQCILLLSSTPPGTRHPLAYEPWENWRRTITELLYHALNVIDLLDMAQFLLFDELHRCRLICAIYSIVNSLHSI